MTAHTPRMAREKPPNARPPACRALRKAAVMSSMIVSIGTFRGWVVSCLPCEKLPPGPPQCPPQAPQERPLASEDEDPDVPAAHHQKGEQCQPHIEGHQADKER